MDFDWDCIVVGAGPAGLSAALTLGRARRRALVLDSGSPRNHAAREMHGVLGHDGLAPSALRERGTEEIARYGIEVRAAEIADVRLVEGGVEVDGERARTLILATGLLDETPAVEGFDAIYGVSAHTCPYCDGWEHRDERIAVLANGDKAGHLGRLLRQWSGDVVVLGETEQEAELAEVGVEVIREPVTRFVHDGGRLNAVEFAGREPLERDALFFYIDMKPRSELAARLGCELNEGGYVVVDELRRTTVDRVYAVGNCADPMLNVPMSIADGARAGAFVNHRLVEEGVLGPVAVATACG
jgi:thioredoxin reductase